MREIINAVSHVMTIPTRLILLNCRETDIQDAKSVCCAIGRARGYRLIDMQKAMGMTDHTTVSNHISRYHRLEAYLNTYYDAAMLRLPPPEPIYRKFQRDLIFAHSKLSA